MSRLIPHFTPVFHLMTFHCKTTSHSIFYITLICYYDSAFEHVIHIHLSVPPKLIICDKCVRLLFVFVLCCRRVMRSSASETSLWTSEPPTKAKPASSYKYSYKYPVTQSEQYNIKEDALCCVDLAQLNVIFTHNQDQLNYL